jgi:hypothetical protein
LINKLGAANVFVVSKARCEGRKRTLLWLQHTNFCTSTGLLLSHVLFTHEKKDKALVCRYLGVGAFVDDLAEVLKEMEGHVPIRILLDAASFSSSRVLAEKKKNREALWKSGHKWGGAPEGMCPVFDWPEVCTILTGLN